MEISEESRKRISLNADTNTPSIVVLYFGRKFFIVVHSKRAIEMFRSHIGTETNSGLRRQSMLLISYAWVPRKYHRKQLLYLERMDHRRRINKVQILRKFLFLDGSLTCLRLRVHFGKSGIVESVYGRLEMEPIQKNIGFSCFLWLRKFVSSTKKATQVSLP